MKTRGQLLLTALIFAFILSYIGAVIQLEAILGAFAAGLVLAETDKRRELEEQVIPVADVFVPIFFVVVGAKTDLGVLNPAVPANREGLTLAIFLIVIAIIGKVVTGLFVFGQPGINRLAIGVGMIPRGEVGLVFLGVGSATGVLSPAMEAAIIMMVILTTFLAPPFLRLVFKEPELEPTASEIPALDGASAKSVAIEPTPHQKELSEDIEAIEE
jgi:Kef-type K+ transport system membrane component KefB